MSCYSQELCVRWPFPSCCLCSGHPPPGNVHNSLMLPLCSALHLGEQFASITVCGLHSPFSADLCAASSAAFPAYHLPAPFAGPPAALRSPRLAQLQCPGSGGHSSQKPHPQPIQFWMLSMCGGSQGKGAVGAHLPSEAGPRPGSNT